MYCDVLKDEEKGEGKEKKEANQLHNLDEHPVVGGVSEELEELRGEGEVVLGVLPGKLADHIDGSRHDTLLKKRKKAENILINIGIF